MKEREKTPRGSEDTTDIIDIRRRTLLQRMRPGQRCQESLPTMMIQSLRRFLCEEGGGSLYMKTLLMAR